MQKMRVPFLGLFFVLVGDNVVAVLLDVVLVVVVGVVADNVKKNRERGKVSRFSFQWGWKQGKGEIYLT